MLSVDINKENHVIEMEEKKVEVNSNDEANIEKEKCRRSYDKDHSSQIWCNCNVSLFVNDIRWFTLFNIAILSDTQIMTFII